MGKNKVTTIEDKLKFIFNGGHCIKISNAIQRKDGEYVGCFKWEHVQLPLSNIIKYNQCSTLNKCLKDCIKYLKKLK